MPRPWHVANGLAALLTSLQTLLRLLRMTSRIGAPASVTSLRSSQAGSASSASSWACHPTNSSSSRSTQQQQQQEQDRHSYNSSLASAPKPPAGCCQDSWVRSPWCCPRQQTVPWTHRSPRPPGLPRRRASSSSTSRPLQQDPHHLAPWQQQAPLQAGPGAVVGPSTTAARDRRLLWQGQHYRVCSWQGAGLPAQSPVVACVQLLLQRPEERRRPLRLCRQQQRQQQEES